MGSGRSALLAGLCHAALNGTVPLRWGLDDVWEWQARGMVMGFIGVVILVAVQLRSFRRVPRRSDGGPGAAAFADSKEV